MSISFRPNNAKRAQDIEMIGEWWNSREGHGLYVAVYKDSRDNLAYCSNCQHTCRKVTVMVNGIPFCMWCVPLSFEHEVKLEIDYLMRQMDLR